VANTLKLLRNGAVGFIDRLGLTCDLRSKAAYHILKELRPWVPLFCFNELILFRPNIKESVKYCRYSQRAVRQIIYKTSYTLCVLRSADIETVLQEKAVYKTIPVVDKFAKKRFEIGMHVCLRTQRAAKLAKSFLALEVL